MLYSHCFFNFALKQDYKMEENQWQQLVQNFGLRITRLLNGWLLSKEKF